MVASDFENVIDRFIGSSGAGNKALQQNASFDFCYSYFKNTDVSVDIEKSCLIIAFYLASWGMLRASSFLFKKSCKHFEELVNYISEQQREQESIWDIDVDTYPENYDLIVKIYSDVKNIVVEKGRADLTLVTKIMLGVYGFVPAFDTYFIKAFGDFNKGKVSFNQFNFKKRSIDKQPLNAIYNFYIENKSVIDMLSSKWHILDFKTGKENDLNYSKAKIIDMYGFQKGVDAFALQ
jgi:hypothetical protein